MVTNQSALDLNSSVIKLFLAEKCKPWEIYRKICMEKHVLIKKKKKKKKEMF